MGERGGECIGGFAIFFLWGINSVPHVTPQQALQPDTVAKLMERFRNGDHDAAGRLVELSIQELRRIAAARMRTERTDHTLQPTAVVHQLYLELVKVKALRADSSEGTG